MPIGVIPALIAAGGSIAGSAIAAHAAGSAADTQAQSGQKALDLQQNLYNQTRADLSPYAVAGQGALGNLRALLGMPATPMGGAAMGGGGSVATGGGGTSLAIPGTGVTRQVPPGSPMVGTAVPRGSAIGSSYVRMMAPSGEIGTVPAEHVGHYTAMGAKVIGG